MTDEVNIPLLRKAVEWAEAEAAKPPERSDWFQSLVYVPANEREEYGLGFSNECGTAYCIAGYITAQVSGHDDPYDAGESACDFAADAIGGDRDLVGELFASNNTIEDVRRIAEDIAGERL